MWFLFIDWLWKDIFVIPGNIYSKTSDGTNYLITEGAIPVLNYKDILDYK